MKNFNINYYLEKIPEKVRWTLIIPAGIIGFLLIELISSFLSILNIPSHFLSLFSNLAGHSLFVLFGALIAPKFRFGVALALAIIVVAVSTISIYFIIKDYLMIEDLMPEATKSTKTSIRSLIELKMIGKVMAILGAGYITYFIKNNEQKLKNV